MLNNNDLLKLQPYLNKGKVVNIEIKEYPKNKKRNAIREIILEYSDGLKLTGNLNDNKLDMKPLTGMTSIVKYFARGKYGSNKWRGNFSGLLVKDLLNHFQPNFVIDPMVGGGTTKEVADDLGISNLCLDLNPNWGGFDALNEELPRSSDFIIWHPPYMVFEGSNMPKYSGHEWGNKPHPSDGSHITDPAAFTKWLNTISANLYTALRKNGRLAILMGDSRYKGQYYSMLKSMNIFGTLENIIIKEQFNCVSDSIQYSGKFIPITHEYLVIIRKTDNFIIPCHIVKNIEIDIRTSEKVTWRTLIQSTIESLGGTVKRKELYEILSKHPKAKSNNNIEAKIRQTLNQFPQLFIKKDEETFSIA